MLGMDPERARQGRLGRPVLIVLVASVALALIVWAGVEIWGEAIEPPPQAADHEGG